MRKITRQLRLYGTSGLLLLVSALPAHATDVVPFVGLRFGGGKETHGHGNEAERDGGRADGACGHRSRGLSGGGRGRWSYSRRSSTLRESHRRNFHWTEDKGRGLAGRWGLAPRAT